MIGYHCTPTKNINSIRKKGFRVNPKIEMPGDLGSDVYFFVDRNGYNNAKEMAVKFGKQYRGKKSNVALSLITVEFDSSHIIDMTQEKSKLLFNKTRKDNLHLIEDRFEKLKKATKYYSGSINRGNLDGYTFDILKSFKPEIYGWLKDTYTPVDMKGYKRSSFPNAIECCIYKVEIIKIKSIESVS